MISYVHRCVNVFYLRGDYSDILGPMYFLNNAFIELSFRPDIEQVSRL